MKSCMWVAGHGVSTFSAQYMLVASFSIHLLYHHKQVFPAINGDSFEAMTLTFEKVVIGELLPLYRDYTGYNLALL